METRHQTQFGDAFTLAYWAALREVGFVFGSCWYFFVCIKNERGDMRKQSMEMYNKRASHKLQRNNRRASYKLQRVTLQMSPSNKRVRQPVTLRFIRSKHRKLNNLTVYEQQTVHLYTTH